MGNAILHTLRCPVHGPVVRWKESPNVQPPSSWLVCNVFVPTGHYTDDYEPEMALCGQRLQHGIRTLTVEGEREWDQH